MTPEAPTDTTRLDEMERKVEDHEHVLNAVSDHLEQVSTELSQLARDFNRVIGWFSDKRTRALALLAVAILLGPDGVQNVKSALGL